MTDFSEQQAEAFDHIGDRYDAVFPHKEGQIAAVKWLDERLDEPCRILDAGCGTGLPAARRLVDAGHRVVGIDISEGMLTLARRNVPEAELHRADIRDLGNELGRFDAIVSFFALLMVPRAQFPDVLHRFHDVLSPGGLVVLGMVEVDLDFEPIDFIGTRVRVSGYPRERLREIVTESGFEVQHESAYSYTPEGEPEVQLFLHCQRA